VPKGVGPMTIAALMRNTYKACVENNWGGCLVMSDWWAVISD
jgi:hypothetical protein